MVLVRQVGEGGQAELGAGGVEGREATVPQVGGEPVQCGDADAAQRPVGGKPAGADGGMPGQGIR